MGIQSKHKQQILSRISRGAGLRTRTRATYFFLPGEDPLAEADRLLVLVHLIVLLVHPLVVGICVQHPLGVDLGRTTTDVSRERPRCGGRLRTGVPIGSGW